MQIAVANQITEDNGTSISENSRKLTTHKKQKHKTTLTVRVVGFFVTGALMLGMLYPHLFQ